MLLNPSPFLRNAGVAFSLTAPALSLQACLDPNAGLDTETQTGSSSTTTPTGATTEGPSPTTGAPYSTGGVQTVTGALTDGSSTGNATTGTSTETTSAGETTNTQGSTTGSTTETGGDTKLEFSIESVNSFCNPVSLIYDPTLQEFKHSLFCSNRSFGNRLVGFNDLSFMPSKEIDLTNLPEITNQTTLSTSSLSNLMYGTFAFIRGGDGNRGISSYSMNHNGKASLANLSSDKVDVDSSYMVRGTEDNDYAGHLYLAQDESLDKYFVNWGGVVNNIVTQTPLPVGFKAGAMAYDKDNGILYAMNTGAQNPGLVRYNIEQDNLTSFNPDLWPEQGRLPKLVLTNDGYLITIDESLMLYMKDPQVGGLNAQYSLKGLVPECLDNTECRKHLNLYYQAERGLLYLLAGHTDPNQPAGQFGLYVLTTEATTFDVEAALIFQMPLLANAPKQRTVMAGHGEDAIYFATQGYLHAVTIAEVPAP